MLLLILAATIYLPLFSEMLKLLLNVEENIFSIVT
jgi:hypothetical protein